MALLELERISAQYPGTDAPVLTDINLSLGPRRLLVALGPSGSGKTSLLNLIAGFVAPSAGRITLDGKPVEGPGAERGVVFQMTHCCLGRTSWATSPSALSWQASPAQNAKPKPAKCSRWSTSRDSATDVSGNFPAGKSSAWAWPVRWPPTRACC